MYVMLFNIFSSDIFQTGYIQKKKKIRDPHIKKPYGHYGTLDWAILLMISMLLRLILNKRTLNRGILFYLNAFVAHSKQWAAFFRTVRLFNMGTDRKNVTSPLAHKSVSFSKNVWNSEKKKCEVLVGGSYVEN